MGTILKQYYNRKIKMYSRTSVARTRRDCQNVLELSKVREIEVP
jgi:hypothetical protein